MHVVQMRLHHNNARLCARLGTRARLIILASAVFWKSNFLSEGLVSISSAGLITGPASVQLSGCALSVSEPRGKTLRKRKRKEPVSPCRPSHCRWLVGRACFTGHVISILAFGSFFFPPFGYLGTHSSVDVTQHCVFTWEQVINWNASWKRFSSSERPKCHSGWEGSNWTVSMSSVRPSLYAGHKHGQTEAGRSPKLYRRVSTTL